VRAREEFDIPKRYDVNFKHNRLGFGVYKGLYVFSELEYSIESIFVADALEQGMQELEDWDE
jgi:hypothetical protein